MSAFLTVALIHLVAVASPGPDFLIVTRSTLVFSRKAGIWTSVGVALANLVHVAYCLLGIGFLISSSILIFNTIKLLGAGYLLFIGFKALTHKNTETENPDSYAKITVLSRTPFESLKVGFLCSVLNPKASLFYLALFTQVINPKTPFSVLLAYGLYLGFATFLWFWGVASFFSVNIIKNKFERIQSLSERIMGGLLILLGLKVALATRNN